MAQYFRLLRSKDAFAQELSIALRDSSEKRPAETASAVSIQRVFRGISKRNHIARLGYYVNEIQRVFRGHMGRVRAGDTLSTQEADRQLSLFHYYCMQIQRCMRGFYSRKYKHDHERRKRYRARIEAEGEQTRAQMADYAMKQAMHDEDQAQASKEQAFRDLAHNLHHLVSTKHIAGVYTPAPQYMETPTMNGVPVETHVRAVVKDLLRSKGISKGTTGLVQDINGTRKIPLKGEKYRLSLQASAPYDTLKKAEQSEQLHHRIITSDKGKWQAGGKTSIINKPVQPLSCGFPYMDPWANPMLVKGPPASTKQLLDSARLSRALWVDRNPERPFVSRVGGNKSSTLPNDLFDVMAEANETGGAAQRHRGTGSTRFGLSASMDARIHGTSGSTMLPAPPVRTSALQKSTIQSLRVYTHGALGEGVLPSVARGMNLQKASLDSSTLEDNFPGDEAKTGDHVHFRTLMPDNEILSSDED